MQTLHFPKLSLVNCSLNARNERHGLTAVEKEMDPDVSAFMEGERESLLCILSASFVEITKNIQLYHLELY